MTEPKITPMMDLMLETVVARHRLGEPWWTFSDNSANRFAANKLAKLGKVVIHSPQTQKTFRVELTEQAKKELRPYSAPILREFRAKVALEKASASVNGNEGTVILRAGDMAIRKRNEATIWKIGFDAGFEERGKLGS
jgi:hypothetical protein